MSEQFYQMHLDFDPSDGAARLLLGDFLDAAGDPRAIGYRWLAKSHVQPQEYASTRTWDWNDNQHFDNLEGAIPHLIFDLLENGRLAASKSYREYPTRLAAEEAFVRAIAPECFAAAPPPRPARDFEIDPFA